MYLQIKAHRHYIHLNVYTFDSKNRALNLTPMINAYYAPHYTVRKFTTQRYTVSASPSPQTSTSHGRVARAQLALGWPERASSVRPRAPQSRGQLYPLLLTLYKRYLQTRLPFNYSNCQDIDHHRTAKCYDSLCGRASASPWPALTWSGELDVFSSLLAYNTCSVRK